MHSCGSKAGKSPAHLEAARALAHAFHAHDIQLVYGGGTVGLMGEVARTLVSLSGPDAVFGVIPEALIKYEQAGRDTATAPGAQPAAAPDSGAANEAMAKHEAEFGRVTVVPDMHTRKQLMAQKVMEGAAGSGFVALSGGYGTLEELMEMTTWNQLGIHACGVCVFSVEGYWDGLLQWVRRAVDQGLVSAANQGIIVEATDAEGVVKALAEYRLSQDRFRLEWSRT